MPVKSTKLGPGTLTVGATGTLMDFSCQMSAAQVTWEVESEDDVIMLCGDTKPGSRTYNASLTGTVDQDLTDEAGAVAWTWANKGTVQPFEFVPNTAAGATVTGDVMVDPLSVGGDTGGADMTSDFTWAVVGEPDLAWAAALQGDTEDQTAPDDAIESVAV